jgi:isopentenyldiphosphate isomerase
MTLELFDVLDETGKPTGEQKTKEQIFAAGDYRLVTHAWVMNYEGEVLCQRRAIKKGLWDGLWDVTVGGGVTSGEDSKDACARELDEELGLVLPSMHKENELAYLGRFKTSKPIPERGYVAREFSDTYFAKAVIDLSGLVLKPDEVMDVAWIPLGFVGLNDGEKEWIPHPESYYEEVNNRLMEFK